jgi:outer membrane protein OmpA-like peptidoglycan-associated protein
MSYQITLFRISHHTRYQLYILSAVFFVTAFFSSCYVANELANENKQTVTLLQKTLQQIEAIHQSNNNLQQEYVVANSGNNIKSYTDSIKYRTQRYLAELNYLTKEKIHEFDIANAKERTAFIKREAENNLLQLKVAEELLATVYALSHVPASSQTGAVLKETLQKIDNINTATDEKLKDNTLDGNSAIIIKNYTDTIKNQTLRHLKEDSIISNMPGKHKNLNDVTARVKKLAAEAQTNLDNIKVVDELLKTNTFTLVKSGDLFSPGKFEFSQDKMPLVEESFSPPANDIISFLKKFPGKQLAVCIVALGYSDAGNINTESTLGKILLDSMKVQTADKSLLNKELSRLRAKSVVSFFDSKFKSVGTPGAQYQYLPQGRGEEIPDALIKDYKANDTRRRVVKVYWTVMPVTN